MSKEDFADWLAREVQARGWTAAELGRQAGFTRQHAARLMNGEYQPGKDAIPGLAAALGMTPETVMRRAGILPDQGEVLAEARDWSARLMLLSPATRAAAIGAIESVLRAIEGGETGRAPRAKSQR